MSIVLVDHFQFESTVILNGIFFFLSISVNGIICDDMAGTQVFSSAKDESPSQAQKVRAEGKKEKSYRGRKKIPDVETRWRARPESRTHGAGRGPLVIGQRVYIADPSRSHFANADNTPCGSSDRGRGLNRAI